MTPELAAFLGQFGLPLTMLVVVLTTGARGVWVFGREMKAALLVAAEQLAHERAEKELARADAREWRGIALKSIAVGERVVSVVAPDG